jgi:hypothetical protein
MSLRFLVKYIFYFFLVGNSFVLANTEFNYYVILDGIEVSGCESECPSDLIIPEEIDGYPVNSIQSWSFREKQLTSVIIPDSVLMLGANTFQNNQLTSISIPETVISIDPLVFAENQLTSLTLPSDLNSIGYGAFWMNLLTSVTIPNSVTHIGGWAFWDNNLTDVFIPNTVVSIEEGVFGLNQLTNLIIPESVTRIGHYSFEWNQLTSVIIPQGVTYIGFAAFYDNQLSNIYFRGDRPRIEQTSFLQNEIENIFYCSGTIGWPGEPIEGITPQIDISCDNSDEEGELAQYSTFDIDQDGSFDALTDGLILLRYAFGIRGDFLINDVIDANATRTNVDDIEAYIQSLVP